MFGQNSEAVIERRISIVHVVRRDASIEQVVDFFDESRFELGVDVLVLPSTVTKNGEERVIPLNSIARQIVDERRGTHPEFVFSWHGKPLARLSNSAWKKAKREADLPIRFHDLRHTFGHRLRAAG